MKKIIHYPLSIVHSLLLSFLILHSQFPILWAFEVPNYITLPTPASVAANSTNSTLQQGINIQERFGRHQNWRLTFNARGTAVGVTGTATFVVSSSVDGTNYDHPNSSLLYITIPINGTNYTQNSDLGNLQGMNWVAVSSVRAAITNGFVTNTLGTVSFDK